MFAANAHEPVLIQEQKCMEFTQAITRHSETPQLFFECYYESTRKDMLRQCMSGVWDTLRFALLIKRFGSDNKFTFGSALMWHVKCHGKETLHKMRSLSFLRDQMVWRIDHLKDIQSEKLLLECTHCEKNILCTRSVDIHGANLWIQHRTVRWMEIITLVMTIRMSLP